MRFFAVILFLVGSVAAGQASRSIALSWDPSPSANVAGYLLYSGTSSASYDSISDVGNVTSAIVSSLSEENSYFFTITAYNTDGVESEFSNEIVAPFLLPVVTTPPAPATTRLLNVSVRGYVRTDDEVMIGGFVISGSASKKVILRGLGPSLTSQGVANAMRDPVLDLHDATGALIATNDGWVAQEDEVLSTGLPPPDSREAALVANLPAGMYSVVVRSASLTPGTALFEIYDLDPTGPSELVNLSTRARVEQGDGVLIGGFIADGASPAAIVLRGIGPSLADVIPNTLVDPILELHDGTGALVFRNDDWATDQADKILASTIAPLDPREAAIYSIIESGSYSGIVHGADNASGVALMEIYNLGTIKKTSH